MHEQEVSWVSFRTYYLRYASRHWNCGYTGRTDQRIYLAAGNDIHNLTAEQAANGGEAECQQTQNNDFQCVQCEERRCNGGCTNGDAQEYGDNVHQRILYGIGQTLCHAAFTPQVAQHQAANQDGGIGQGEGNDDGNNDREEDLLSLGNLARAFHHDLTLFFGGQNFHDGRLDNRHQRHVAVRGNRDGTQQVRGQAGGDEDSGRAIGTADDADGSGFLVGEAQDFGANEGEEDAQLCGSAQQQAGRTCDQRLKVGHGTDAKENQRGIDTQFDA